MADEKRDKLRHTVNNFISIEDAFLDNYTNSIIIRELESMIKIGKYLLKKNECEEEIDEYLYVSIYVKTAVLASKDTREFFEKKSLGEIYDLEEFIGNRNDDFREFIKLKEEKIRKQNDNEIVSADKTKKRIVNLLYQFNVINRYIQSNKSVINTNIVSIYMDIVNQFNEFVKNSKIGDMFSKSEYIAVQRIISASFSCIIHIKKYDNTPAYLEKLSELANDQKGLIDDYCDLINKKHNKVI